MTFLLRPGGGLVAGFRVDALQGGLQGAVDPQDHVHDAAFEHPQDVAHLDAKKVVTLVRDADVPLLGAVENMSGFVCPHCGERHDVFPRVAEERSLWSDGVERLAEIPLDPSLAHVNGVPPAFAELAGTLRTRLAG